MDADLRQIAVAIQQVGDGQPDDPRAFLFDHPEAAAGDRPMVLRLAGRPALRDAREADAGEALGGGAFQRAQQRSEEHTSELQSLMRISYAVFCLNKKNNTPHKSQYYDKF